MNMFFMLTAVLTLVQADGAKLTFGSGFSAPLVQGFAGYPISRDRAVFISDSKIYLIRTEYLTPEQIKSFQNIGAVVSVPLTPEDIEYSWSTESREAPLRAPATALSASGDAIVGQEANLKVSGLAILSTSDQYSFVQINNWIYQIERESLDKSEREKLNSPQRIEVIVPKKALKFAWTSNGHKAQGRVPASLAFPKDVVLKKDDHLFIQGKTLYSFDDDSILVQSGDKIFELKKSLVSGPPGLFSENSDVHVSLTVPVKGVIKSWGSR